MADVTDLKVTVTGDSTGGKKAIDDVNKSASDTPGFFKTAAGALAGFLTGTVLIGGATAAFGFLTENIKESVAAASSDQMVQAQLNAALKSTHDSVGISASGLNDLAEKLSMTTTFSKDTTLQAEVLALRFQNIGSAVFPQVITQAQNLSARMGIDLNSAIRLVGRATDDPVKGLTALTRVGVTFTEAQKEQIKTLVANGDTMKAQQIILGDLQEKFGGAATAAGSTFAGKLQILQNSFEEIRIKIGDAIIPILSDLLTAVTPIINAMGNILPPILNKVADFLSKDVTPAVDYVSTHMQQFEPVLIAAAGIMAGILVTAFILWAAAAASAAVATIAATWPVLAIVAALGLLAAAILYAYNNWGWFRAVVDTVVASTQRGITVFGQILGILGNLAGLVGGAVGHSFQLLGESVNIVENSFRSFWNTISGILGTLGNLIGAASHAASTLSSIHLPGGISIPGFAVGGTTPGGAAIVGELGPELALFPPGTRILPNSVTAQLMQGNITTGSTGLGSFGVGNQVIVVQLDRDVLAKAVVKGTPKQVWVMTGLRSQ